MSEKTKKRKRHSSTHHASPPSKRAVAERASADIAVNVLPPASGAPNVIVASAPGFDIPSKTRFSLCRKRRDVIGARTTSTSNSHSNETYEYGLSASQNTLEYTGCEDRRARDENKIKSYVGVYDPATGQLQVMEACKMVLRVSLRAGIGDEENEEEDNMKTPRQTNGMLRRELGLEFGTKKAKKAIETNSQNTPATVRSAYGADSAKNYDDDNDDVSPTQSKSTPNKSLRQTDPLAAAILDSMDKSESHMPTREDMQAASDAAKPRPQANLDAQTPAEVYPIGNLIAEDHLQSMTVKDWHDAIRNGQEVVQSSKFVARRLTHIVQKNDVQSLRLLKYISTLRDFYAALKLMRGGGRRLPAREQLKEKTGVNNYILDCIRERFTNGSEMTKWHVDNLITHIFAMVLLVDNYETDTSDIREDFQLDTKQLSSETTNRKRPREAQDQAGRVIYAPYRKIKAPIVVSEIQGNAYKQAAMTFRCI